ncbi:hypothetical protein Tcan_00969, partial [Toxocara canis]
MIAHIFKFSFFMLFQILHVLITIITLAHIVYSTSRAASHLCGRGLLFNSKSEFIMNEIGELTQGSISRPSFSFGRNCQICHLSSELEVSAVNKVLCGSCSD